MNPSFTRLEHLGAADTNPAQSTLVEQSVTFGGGVAEIHQLRYARPSTCIWSCDKHYISFALGRRRDLVWATYPDMPMPRQPVGRFMLVPAGRTVQTGGPEGKERSLVCLLADDAFDAILPSSATWSDGVLADGLHLTSAEVRWLLLKIYHEVREEQFASKIVIESLATTLVVTLARLMGLGEGVKPMYSGGLAPWRMRRIRERVLADLPPPTIKELAQISDMSVRHLTRAFKAETGQTVAQYVQQVVIERAHVLLADSNTPINEIARLLGFATSTSFASAFRTATGLRPSDIPRDLGRSKPV